MGIYDVNLKKTNIGYQFDRNVYIGIQTNDNRVVTFKDLGEAIVTSGVGGSGEDIHLTFESINPEHPISAPDGTVDRVSFRRNNELKDYDIVPQYVRAATSNESFPSDGKACVLVPVVKGSGAEATTVGYKVYVTDTPPLQIKIGSNITYTYSGTAAVDIQFTAVPTVSVSSLGVVTEIPNNDTSTDIPTAGAVHKFAAAAGSVKATASAAGYILGTPTQVTAQTIGPDTPALPPVGSDLKWGTSASDVGTATSWVNANVTGQLNKTLSIGVGATTYSFNGSNNTSIQFNTIPTVSTSSLGVTATIPSSAGAADADIPTAKAVREAIDALAPGIRQLSISGSGSLVNHLSYDSSQSVLTAYKNASLNNAALAWGTSTTYATIESNTYSISLPTVDTIPTVSTSSLGITSTVSASSSSDEIPTAEAVWKVANAAGKVKEIQLGGVTQSISTAGVVNLPSYPTVNDSTITIKQTGIADQTFSLNGGAATINLVDTNTWRPLGTGSNDAAAGNHTHANFTVFGQSYNGATARTVTAGNGITVSNGSVSLNATFNNATLAWGASVNYATVAGSQKFLSLPQVSTIPTVSTSSMGITGTISSSSSYIPTSAAVKSAIDAKFEYNAANGVLTIKNL